MNSLNKISLRDDTHVARSPHDPVSDLVGSGADLLEVDNTRVGGVAPGILCIVGGGHLVHDDDEA